jgi:hypothetical protein
MGYLWIHQSLEYPAKPFIATSRYYYRGARCEYVQRHPASTLLLLPVDGRPSVIWLMPDRDGRPDFEAAEAIVLDGRSGIAVHPGTWHRFAYPLLGSADFWYVSSRVDPEDDIERVHLERDFGVTLEWYFGAPAVPGVRLTDGGAVVGLPPSGGVELDLGIGGRIQRPDERP